MEILFLFFLVVVIIFFLAEREFWNYNFYGGCKVNWYRKRGGKVFVYYTGFLRIISPVKLGLFIARKC